MFGAYAPRWLPDKGKGLPGPGSYTPDLEFERILPRPRTATALIPKPEFGAARYNYLSRDLSGEVLVLKDHQNNRLGPGCYHVYSTLGTKSYNIIALDSMRHRNRVLAPQAAPPPQVKPRRRQSARPTPAASLMRRAQELLLEIKGT